METEFRGFEIRLESECGHTSGKCKVHEDQLSWTNRNWDIKASKRQIQFLFHHKVCGSRVGISQEKDVWHEVSSR